MEIYTGDLITDAQECAERIGSNMGYAGRFVEDELCNLQRDIRRKIYDRLALEFLRLDTCDETRAKLYKMINEL